MEALTEALTKGEHDRAIQSGRDALRLAAEAFLEADPRLTLPLYGLASALLAAGELEEAAALLTRALDLSAVKTPSDEVVSRGQLLEMRASIALKRGEDLDATETLLRRWVDARLAETPPLPIALATAQNQLGLFLGRRDKRKEAAECFAKARVLRSDALGSDHRLVAEAIYNAATFREKDRPLDKVKRDLLEVVRLTQGDDDGARSLLASALHNLAVILDEMGQSEDARLRYTEALAKREAVSGPDSPALRPTLVRLAQLHHREGRILFALPLYERALAIAKRELGDAHPIVRAIETWKAELMEGA